MFPLAVVDVADDRVDVWVESDPSPRVLERSSERTTSAESVILVQKRFRTIFRFEKLNESIGWKTLTVDHLLLAILAPVYAIRGGIDPVRRFSFSRSPDEIV